MYKNVSVWVRWFHAMQILFWFDLIWFDLIGLFKRSVFLDVYLCVFVYV